MCMKSYISSNLCKGDVGEFNQCQSQLQMLFADGLPGSVTEFMAYRLLYYIMQGSAVGKCKVDKKLTGKTFENS